MIRTMRLVRFGHLACALVVSTACGSQGGFPARDGGVRDAGEITVCNAQSPDMTFFMSHEGNITGNFGGLAGADQFCQQAATASGSTRTDWVAYLSALDDATFGRVDARDRIGQGPWFNYCGDSIGNLDEIHVDPGLPAALILSEQGLHLDPLNEEASFFLRAHDIATGSDEFGVLVGGTGPDDPPVTCADWTSDSPDDQGFVGHEDWDEQDGRWNAAHPSMGCDEQGFAVFFGNARIYCFATGT